MRSIPLLAAVVLALASRSSAQGFSETAIQEAISRARAAQTLTIDLKRPPDPCAIAALDSALDGGWATRRVLEAEGPVERMARHIIATNELEALGVCPALVMRDPLVNAAAWERRWPTGPLRFIETTTGALKKITSDDELAGMLAHELAHHVLRHGYGMRVLGIAAKGLPPVWRELWLAKETRLVEREADFLATYLMAKAGYDPRGLAALHRMLKTVSSYRPFTYPLDDHPRAADRIRLAEELAKSARLMNPNPGKPVAAIAELRALGY